MDKSYHDLFVQITQLSASLAEKVLDNETEKGEDTAASTKMRDDYLNLKDKLNDETQVLERADFARLLVGTLVVTQALSNQLSVLTKTLDGYRTSIIPGLERIINETTDDAGALALADEIFRTKEVQEEEQEQSEKSDTESESNT